MVINKKRKEIKMCNCNGIKNGYYETVNYDTDIFSSPYSDKLYVRVIETVECTECGEQESFEHYFVEEEINNIIDKTY